MQRVKGSSADIKPITTRLKELVGRATNKKSYWDGGWGGFMQEGSCADAPEPSTSVCSEVFPV